VSSKAVDLMKERLGAYLLEQVPALKEVMQEWPEANQQLDYPSLVIMGNSPEYSNLMTYRLSMTDPVNNKRLVRYVIGQYDLTMHLTIWCRNKQERRDIHEAIFLAMNPQIEPSGLVLSIPDYFDVQASYDISGHELPDTEEAAQRREWRATLRVLGHVKAVIEREEFSMSTIETTLETPDTIPEP